MYARPLSLLAVVGLAASVAHAQTDIPWLGGSGNWSVASNWAGGNIPNDASERAVVDVAGMFTVSSNANFTVNGLFIPNTMATVAVNNATSLSFAGDAPVIDHVGSLIVNPNAGGSGTLIQFNSSGLIQGSGALVLNAHPANLDTAYLQTSGPAIITNAAGHLIRGTGNIHAGFTNDGVVSADVDSRTLQLVSAPKTNNGLLAAAGGGTFQISSVGVTQSASGVVRAQAGGIVNLLNCSITGGSLESEGDGVVRVTGNSTLSDVLNFSGTLQVNDARVLSVLGGLPNNGTITINPGAGGNGTLVQFNNSGEFSGSGTVVLNSHPANLDTSYLQTIGVGTVMTNGPDHLVRGAGRIHAAFTNNGTVRADVNGRVLDMTAAPKTNNHRMEATGGGTLQASSITLSQGPAGVLFADNATLSLNSCTIAGGMIEAINGGVVQVTNSSTFAGLASLDGPLNIPDARTLNVSGGLTHSGTLSVNPTAGGNGTFLQFTTSGVLGGPGEVVLSSHPANLDTSYIQTSGGAVVTNADGHLVRGAGRIHAALANDGTVRADVAGRILELTSAAKTNASRMEAVNTGVLQVSSIGLTQSATGLLAADNATLNLNACTITGGSIQAINAGLVSVVGSSTLADVLSLDGPLHVPDARSLSVSGGLTHTGTITINPTAGGNGTLLTFTTSGVLGGAGDVRLNSHPANPDTSYLQTAGASVMTNASGHLVHGTGRIHAAFANNGVVRADVAGRTLELTSAAKSNAGVMEAVTGATLQVSSITLTQDAAGVLSADNGTVNLNACAVIGGTIQAVSGGLVQVVGSSTLTDVDSVDGRLNVNDARSLVINGGLSHTGVIAVNPTAGGNATLIQFNTTGELSGPGSVILNAHPANLDTAYLTTAGAAVMSNAPGHTIGGRGRLYGSFVNNGIISPGDDDADRTNFIQRQGNYTCGPTAQVVIDLDGTAQGSTYDWLEATGSLSLDGALLVRLAPGYIPPRNTVFTVASGATRVGQFSSVTLPALPPSLGYPRLEYTGDAVRVRVPLCPTDWNARDGINSQDFFDFLSDFFAGTADFNFDGFINSQDFFDFLTSFFGGCK